MQLTSLARAAILLLLVSLVTACGGPAQTATPTGGNASEGKAPPATEGEAPTSSEESTSKDPVQVYAYINTGALNRLPEGSDPKRLAEVNTAVAEATGVEIVPIYPPSGGAATEKLNLLLSSPNERLDLVQANWTEYAEAVLPLNDLLEKHGQHILKAWPQESWDKMTDAEGNIMGIPRGTPGAPYPIWVRSDLLEQFNMEPPKTIEDLEAFMQAYKESDPNAIPLLVGRVDRLMSTTLGAFTKYGNSNWVDPADNTLKPPMLQPGFKDWVAKMADWYAKGYIYKDTLGIRDGNKLREVVKGQKVGATATWYSIVTLSVPALNQANPDIKFEFVNLTGPEGASQTVTAAGVGGMLITKRAPNPEAIIKFIDWQYASLDNFLTTFYGIKDKDWKYVDNVEGTENLRPGTKLVQVGEPSETGYAGELNWSLGLPMETKYVVIGTDGKISQHYEYINCCITDVSVGKMPVDGGVAYDEEKVEEVFPSEQDFERYVEENLINFITGARPLSEWDAFISGLQDVGLDQWIEAYSSQYMARQQQ